MQTALVAGAGSRKGWGWLWPKAGSGPLANKICQVEDVWTTRGDVHVWACLRMGTCTCKHKRVYIPHAQVHMQTDAKHLRISTHVQKGTTPRRMHTHENSHACALKHPKPILGLTPRPKDKVNVSIRASAHKHTLVSQC